MQLIRQGGQRSWTTTLKGIVDGFLVEGTAFSSGTTATIAMDHTGQSDEERTWQESSHVLLQERDMHAGASWTGSTCLGGLVVRSFLQEGEKVGKVPSRYSTSMGVCRELLGDVS